MRPTLKNKSILFSKKGALIPFLLILTFPSCAAFAETNPHETTVVDPADLSVSEGEWKPINNSRECIGINAGYGKRARAICYHMLTSHWYGPYLIVVPANEHFPNPFAIGKHEISVKDYSKYCALTNNCEPETKKKTFDYPITGISLNDVRLYITWLSERTGKVYRLPTLAEWKYAAMAVPDKHIDEKFNCQGNNSDNIEGNIGPVEINNGTSNKWGLKNYIGNVQELVTGPDNTLMAAGGHYLTDQSECTIDHVKPHNGKADEFTGFRVLMEME